MMTALIIALAILALVWGVPYLWHLAARRVKINRIEVEE